jgi:hypothetical protein
MKLPLTLPLDAYTSRRASIENLGDVIGGKGQSFMVIELKSEAEVTAATTWLGRQIAIWEFGPQYGSDLGGVI